MTETQAEHFEYMLKKQQKTLSLWEGIMHRSVSWSDFPHSEKPVTVETGYVLQVPPFVESGDRIQIDTRTGDYMTRVKD